MKVLRKIAADPSTPTDILNRIAKYKALDIWE